MRCEVPRKALTGLFLFKGLLVSSGTPKPPFGLVNLGVAPVGPPWLVTVIPDYLFGDLDSVLGLSIN